MNAPPHVCVLAKGCICSVVAGEPDELCPEHGHPWPPRCERGHFLRWDTMAPPPIRRFVCYFYHTNWTSFQLGLHFDLRSPNIELHVPFGFFRLGWVKPVRIKTMRTVASHVFGYEGPLK